MFFHEIGSLLKNKREEKGISHEDIVSKLKIPLRSIIAIEKGNLEELPHEVYIRTFLKGYASFVGFSTEEIRTLFTDIDDFKDEEEPPKSLEAQRDEKQPEAVKSKSVRFTIQLLLVALLGASAYFYYAKNGRSDNFNVDSLASMFDSNESETQNNQKTKNPNKASLQNSINSDTQSTINQVPSYSTTLKSDSNDTLNKKSMPKNADKNANGNGTKVSDVVNLDEAKESATSNYGTASSNTEDFATFIATTPEAVVINWDILSDVKPGQQQAVIYVTQDCWMSAVIDGTATHFTLRKGSQREFLFSDKLQLKLGNASAVTLFYNRELINVGDSTLLRTINLGNN